MEEYNQKLIVDRLNRPESYSLEIVKFFTGSNLVPKLDEQGNCVVGYGRLVNPDQCSAASAAQTVYVNPSTAESWLEDDLVLSKQVALSFSENYLSLNNQQQDAIASFILDLGQEHFLNSNVASNLSVQAFHLIPRALVSDVSSLSGKSTSFRRRNCEAALFIGEVTVEYSSGEALRGSVEAGCTLTEDDLLSYEIESGSKSR